MVDVERDEFLKLSAERKFLVVSIYRVILDHLKVKEITSLSEEKIEKIIEGTKDSVIYVKTSENRVLATKWTVIQHEALLMRREILIKRGTIEDPSYKDIKEATEALAEECGRLSKDSKKHLAFFESILFS